MTITEQIQALRNNQSLIKKLDAVENMHNIKKQCEDLTGVAIVKKGYNIAPVNVLGVTYPQQTTFKISI